MLEDSNYKIICYLYLVQPYVPKFWTVFTGVEMLSKTLYVAMSVVGDKIGCLAAASASKVGHLVSISVDVGGAGEIGRLVVNSNLLVIAASFACSSMSAVLYSSFFVASSNYNRARWQVCYASAANFQCAAWTRCNRACTWASERWYDGHFHSSATCRARLAVGRKTLQGARHYHVRNICTWIARKSCLPAIHSQTLLTAGYNHIDFF